MSPQARGPRVPAHRPVTPCPPGPPVRPPGSLLRRSFENSFSVSWPPRGRESWSWADRVTRPGFSLCKTGRLQAVTGRQPGSTGPRHQWKFKKKKKKVSRRSEQERGIILFQTCLKRELWPVGFSPLIYTVCSETYQGVFALGVLFRRPARISALRVGTATSAAPGGPVGHKTSRGLLALRLSSVHLPCPHFVGARLNLGATEKGCPGWTSSLQRGLSEGEAWARVPWEEMEREGWGADREVSASRRVWLFPGASDETCKEWTSSRSRGGKQWPGPCKSV